LHEKFWMFDWLEDHHITSTADVMELLPKYGVIDDLRTRAEEWQEKHSVATPNDAVSLVAGAGIDLTGGDRLVCPSPVCMRRQVDTLFKRAWHYFDEMVVQDIFAPTLLGEEEGTPYGLDVIREVFLTHIEPLLYLREIGAEDLVDFQPKIFCEEHWEEHAREQGLDSVLALTGSLITQLRSHVRFYYEDGDSGNRMYRIDYPDLGVSADLGRESPPKFESSASVTEYHIESMQLEELFRWHIACLTGDIATATKLKMPLGTVHGFEASLLSLSRPIEVSDVVFQLQLPVLDGLPTSTLIKLREQESDSFAKFRNSLRRAAQERLKAGLSDNAKLLADEIRMDVIEPSLNVIRQRLASSQKAMVKKTSVGLFLGAVATTCGLLYNLPPPVAISAGMSAALTATGVAANKQIEEESDVALDDMYFLWQAERHAH